MAVITGIGGAVNGVGGVREWSINYIGSPAQYVSSATKGGVGRLCGTRDWNGQFISGTYNTAFFPGKSTTFNGAASAGAASGTVFIDSLEIAIPIEEPKPIEYTVRFSGDGALSLSGSASDASTPAEVCSTTYTVTLGGSTVNDVRSVTVTVTAQNVEYVSSSTSGWKKRKAGTIDASMALSRYLDSIASIPTPNSVQALVVSDGATELVKVEWFKLTEVSDVKVSPSTNEIVACTINGLFTGFDATSSFATGEITLSSTTEWPV